MATSRSLGAVLAVAALALASCGGGGRAHAPSAWAWLHPAEAPAGWAAAGLPSGAATVAYPRSWRRIATDPGTISAAKVDRNGRIVGYLNATPRQADESLASWATFRPHHNAQEGDRRVRRLAAGRDLPFKSGRGSCVLDTYRTSRASYREIACLVQGTRRSTVIVAAATTGAWPSERAQLERAVRTFRT